MSLYCCGFLFDRARDHVWLLRKARPAWQAGRLNGIGGKIEPGETPQQAQSREFLEEAGVRIDSWRPIAIHAFSTGALGHFFAAEVTAAEFAAPRSLTDEPVYCFPVADLWARDDLMPNLRVHLALALYERAADLPPIEVFEQWAA